jgi:hypothetical protein
MCEGLGSESRSGREDEEARVLAGNVSRVRRMRPRCVESRFRFVVVEVVRCRIMVSRRVECMRQTGVGC